MIQTRNITVKYISSIPSFINYLYLWIYSSYILHKKLNKILKEQDWHFVLFCDLKSLIVFALIYFHLFNHFLSFAITNFHFLSLIVIHCHLLLFVVICCHSICHLLSFVVSRCTTRCHSLYHSLSYVVTLIIIRCHSLSLDVPLAYLFINDQENYNLSLWIKKLHWKWDLKKPALEKIYFRMTYSFKEYAKIVKLKMMYFHVTISVSLK